MSLCSKLSGAISGISNSADIVHGAARGGLPCHILPLHLPEIQQTFFSRHVWNKLFDFWICNTHWQNRTWKLTVLTASSDVSCVIPGAAASWNDNSGMALDGNWMLKCSSFFCYVASLLLHRVTGGEKDLGYKPSCVGLAAQQSERLFAAQLTWWSPGRIHRQNKGCEVFSLTCLSQVHLWCDFVLSSLAYLNARHVRSDPRSPYWRQLQLSKQHWIQLMFVLCEIDAYWITNHSRMLLHVQWCSMFNHPLDLVVLWFLCFVVDTVLPFPRSSQQVTTRHFAKCARRQQEVAEKKARRRKVGQQKGNGECKIIQKWIKNDAKMTHFMFLEWNLFGHPMVE